MNTVIFASLIVVCGLVLLGCEIPDVDYVVYTKDAEYRCQTITEEPDYVICRNAGKKPVFIEGSMREIVKRRYSK